MSLSPTLPTKKQIQNFLKNLDKIHRGYVSENFEGPSQEVVFKINRQMANWTCINKKYPLPRNHRNDTVSNMMKHDSDTEEFKNEMAKLWKRMVLQMREYLEKEIEKKKQELVEYHNMLVI